MTKSGSANVLLAATAAIFGVLWAVTSGTDANTGVQFKISSLQRAPAVLTPSRLHSSSFGGFLGKRYEANMVNWLLAKDEDSLLTCYTHRPGYYGWQGEHVGKWIHATTLAWSATQNNELRKKLDRVVSELRSTQMDDGYLGTYRNGFHWSNGRDEMWDVWVHKYNLIGLLTYAEHTGNAEVLESAQHIGDLLIRTFGPGGSLRLNEQGAHRGMVAGSLLEPMVLLYRATHDTRYLQFAMFIAEEWEKDDGPKLMNSLSKGNPVSETANGKAYEMLSCLNGLCELYRETGLDAYLTPVLNAWEDIKRNQLFPTGSGSVGEFWQAKSTACKDTCDGAAEVCVTVSWIQVNQQLLRLTGKVQYADEIEKTLYNHLAAAQKPDGTAWSYFTNLQGRREYDERQTCCSSSGPRGFALLPSCAIMNSNDGIAINLFMPFEATVVIPSGDTVTIRQTTDYPSNGKVNISVSTRRPVVFALQMRVPGWSKLIGANTAPGTYHRVQREWSGTTSLAFNFEIPTRLEHARSRFWNRVAVVRGPQVLTSDYRYNKILLSLPDTTSLSLTASGLLDEDRQPVFSLNAFHYLNETEREASFMFLSPFSSAGTIGTPYSIWIPIPTNTSGN